MRHSHPTWIEIDLKQFLQNIQIIRSHIGKSLYCLPVKANAYGHGLCEIGKAAENHVDYLGVSCLQEGVELREAGIKIPILVLGAIHEEQIDELIKFDLEITIASKLKADMVAKRIVGKNRCRIHLEVDTGMQRTGVQTTTALSLYAYLSTLPCFEIAGIYSHLASSESPNDPIGIKQIELFENLLKNPLFDLSSLIVHIAGSGAVTYIPNSHLGMVRPGLLSYGYLPENYPHSFHGIAPIFSLKSRIGYSKVIDEGIGIGYGHSYRTSRRSRIVTIPIGYGDGYRRDLSNKGSVLIRGKRFPVVGTICMDQLMVDAGDEDLRVGDEVVIIGKQGSDEIKLTDIARACNTIPYEVLCFFNNRVPRFFI